MFVSIIPSEHIFNHLDRVRELIERVRDLLHPRGLPGDVLADCIAGNLVLWGVFDPERIGVENEEPLRAIVVTNVVQYWRCKTLELIVLSGDGMKEWLDEVNEVTDRYARDAGCLIREIPGGRKAWLRVLSKYGFHESNLMHLECPVGEEGRITAD